MEKKIKRPRISNRLCWILAMSPFVIVILVNETARFNQKQEYHFMGVSVINDEQALTNQCSWNCHNQTNYCKKHHVKYLKQHFSWVDPIYFGIINLLMSTGNYGLANLVFLVFLWPFIIYLLVLRVISNRKYIKTLRHGDH